LEENVADITCYVVFVCRCHAELGENLSEFFWEPFLHFWELISGFFGELIGVQFVPISDTTFFTSLLPQPFRQQKAVGAVGEGCGEEG
jgi:hypothetical protein